MSYSSIESDPIDYVADLLEYAFKNFTDTIKYRF